MDQGSNFISDFRARRIRTPITWEILWANCHEVTEFASCASLVPALLSQIGECAIGKHVKSIEAIETDYKKHRKTIGIYVQTLLHDLGCRSVAAAKKQGIDAFRRQSHRRD